LQRSIGLEFFGGENNERRLHALLSVRQAAMLLYTMSLEIALGGTSASYGVLVELVYRKSDITEIGFHVFFFFFSPSLARFFNTGNKPKDLRSIGRKSMVRANTTTLASNCRTFGLLCEVLRWLYAYTKILGVWVACTY
jgi:hypothetical protein